MGQFLRTQLKRYTYFQNEQWKPVLDADGNPVIDEDSGEAQTELAQGEQYFYGNFFPVEVEPTTYGTGLYLIDYNTQLSGKFKLWRANDYWLKINSTAQQTVTSPVILRTNTLGTQISIIGNDIKLFTDNYTGAGKAYYKGREIVSEVDNNGGYYVRFFNQWFKCLAGAKMTLTPDTAGKTYSIIHQNTTRTNTANAAAAGTGIINSITSDATGHITATTYTDLINRSKKLDHNVTINLTDADSKNGVKGSVTTDFSGTTINIATEISPLDASKITSGIISIDRLPQGVLERLVPVANKAARLALTSAQVQKGDTVKQIDTGEMWYVVDDTKLNQDAGYEVYTSGRASAVPWTGVEGKPTKITLSTDLSGAVSLGAGELTLPGTIVANAVTNAKLADMSANTIKARQGSVGDPQDLTPAQIRTMLNIADGANKYIHPTYTARSSAFYKFSVDSTGHVPGVTAVTETDVMGLHTAHTAYSAGLYKVTVNNKGHVSAATLATNADIMGLHSTYTVRAAGLYKITVDNKGHVSAATAAANADIMGLHTTYTARAQGLYKVTVDNKGHVSAVAAVTKADITGLGIPAQDTTYSNFTRSAAGLVPASGGSTTNRFLREDATWAAIDLTNYATLDGTKAFTGITIGGVSITGPVTGTVQFSYGGKVAKIIPAGQSTFDGSIYAAGGGYGSDIRFKRDIAPIDTSVASEIKFHQFFNKRIGKQSAGVVAQELEYVLPEAVYTDKESPERYKYVDYNYVFSIMLESHRKEISDLKEKSIDLNKLSIRGLLKLILLKILKLK